jgi:hypothetical protein
MLREAKKGLPVSGDASAHHAHLSEIDLGYRFPGHDPAARSPRDRDAALWTFADGTIDALPDHAGDEDAKCLCRIKTGQWPELPLPPAQRPRRRASRCPTPQQ